jgi:uroporphyrinogen III methyltransferase / synthase
LSIPERSGRVYLVGAGPGDPSLLTVRAVQLIAQAEVILYDRLIPESALQGARPEAELLFVGKQGGGSSVPQQQIQQLMLDRARRGLSVVRLKGGDPLVFGRGGEEALALTEAGIPFEIVPGITAGVAAGAYAGIPLTYRGRASAVALITGHEDPQKEQTEIDWAALAAFPGTLVFYMGVRALASIAAALIAHGRAPSEPVAVIEKGTLPEQRTVTATLQTIAERAGKARIGAPSVTIVGSVVTLAEQLDWHRARPLEGCKVAVTRARSQASTLALRLEELGASVIQAPVIRIRALDGDPVEVRPYDLICLTSANGVHALFERLAAGAKDARSLQGIRIAAVGPGTAAALREHGILADIVPERNLAEGLLDALAEISIKRCLIAQGRKARDLLARGLRERGVQVDVLALYDTLAEPLSPQSLSALGGADYITFTSASTVHFFADASERSSPGRARNVSIGPITSAALAERGLPVDLQAAEHNLDGLLAAITADYATRKRL